MEILELFQRIGEKGVRFRQTDTFRYKYTYTFISLFFFLKLGSNVRKAGATGHPKGQLWLLLPGHTRPGSSSRSGLTPTLAVLEEVLQVKILSDLWGMSRRGCPGLCAEFLSQPSSSAVCPYNPVNTVVRGKFISLKAAFLSPLSLLLWF